MSQGPWRKYLSHPAPCPCQPCQRRRQRDRAQALERAAQRLATAHDFFPRPRSFPGDPHKRITRTMSQSDDDERMERWRRELGPPLPYHPWTPEDDL